MPHKCVCKLDPKSFSRFHKFMGMGTACMDLYLTDRVSVTWPLGRSLFSPTITEHLPWQIKLFPVDVSSSQL